MNALPAGLSPGPGSVHPRPSPQAVAGTFVALLAIKAIWLAGDSTLRLFMGDSASYLHTALTGWVPPDRSFTYGLVVRVSAVDFGSPLALVLLQTVFGIATCLLLIRLLYRELDVRWGLAAAAGLLFAAEPAQLLYERMMMAESAGTLAVTLHVLLLAIYARTGQWRWVPAAVLAGIATISFRFSLLPVVLGLAATVPVVAALHAPRRGSLPLAIVLHLSMVLLVTAGLHLAYLHASKETPQSEATYLPASGMMRIGLVAPMIRAEHFDGTGVPGTILSEVKQDLADPRKREAQVWAPDGLYQTIARHTAQPEQVARTLTSRALGDDPLRLVQMGWGNATDYFDPGMRGYRIHDDLGRRPPDAGVLKALRDHLHYDAQGVASSESWVTRWFEAGVPWLIGCLFLLAPLALLTLMLSWHRPARPAVFVLCLASCGLVASHLLFAHIPSLRYLHPMPWFVLANLAVLADALLRRPALRVRESPGRRASSSRGGRG